MYAKHVILALGLGCLFACEPVTPSDYPFWDQRRKLPHRLEEIRRQKHIVVLTRNAPTTYFEGRDGLFAGLEHDLIQAFANHLGVQVRFKVFATTAQVLAALEGGSGHLAAAGLSKTTRRQQAFRFGPVYQTNQLHLVCYKNFMIKKLSRLTEELVVSEHSSYHDYLLEAQDKAPKYQTILESPEEILQGVASGQYPCTLIESNILGMQRQKLSGLHVLLTLKQQEHLAWAFPSRQTELVKAVESWFTEFIAQGRLRALIDKYYGHGFEFDSYDVRQFFERWESILPKYKATFQAAEQRTGFPWRLLAVIAYQESHWNPTAVSATGVKGMMMLTLPTARSLGVSNRFDAKASIMGGARYLRQIYDRFPGYLKEQDRLWMTVAAYNVGYNHLRDARMLAVWLGRNPNRWHDVELMLPRLSQKRYYQKLPHGYARGREPVAFVRRIRSYLKLIENDANPTDTAFVGPPWYPSATKAQAQPKNASGVKPIRIGPRNN